MALGKKVVAKKETVKKDTKPTVVVKGSDFAEKLSKRVSVDEDIKNLTAEKSSLDGDIKVIALDEYKKMYTQMKRNPDSIVIQSEKGDKVMLVVLKNAVCL